VTAGDEHTDDRHTEADARTWGEVLGPGLITGAADDDPSGIGTYSQIWAQFVFSLAWIMVFSSRC
jgi:Mn2+/Fe2+ NRAMP family transporter